MAQTAMGLLNTSVDDCKASMAFITDLNLLRQAKALCKHNGHKTRLKVIAARIKQLERAQEVESRANMPRCRCQLRPLSMENLKKLEVQ